MNLFQPLSGVIAVLNDDDLNALADGTYKAKTTVTYTQKLTVPNALTTWAVVQIGKASSRERV